MSEFVSKVDRDDLKRGGCLCWFTGGGNSWERTFHSGCPVHGLPSQPAASVDDGAAVIADRAATHGDFRVTATVSQMLHDVMSDMPNWLSMDPMAREALIMIGVKLARIGSGKSDAVDHWRDVAGYAQLMVDELNRRAVAGVAA